MTQPALSTRTIPTLSAAGLQFRDLDRNGVLDPYEDWRLPARARADDLLARMTLAEKAGAMMHGTAPTDGNGLTTPARAYDVPKATALILETNVTSMITRLSIAPGRLAVQNNVLQEIAERGRLGIPVLISTDPRNHFSSIVGAGVDASGFSMWPSPLGLASSGDPELVRRFGDIARREYRAVGIQMALSPQADLATEPRWPRIDGTFGEDPQLVSRLVRAYVEGFQNGANGVGPASVAVVVKHWVGYGASQTGFDGHNYYGRYSVFPGGRFADHLLPFDAAFAAHVAAVMPTYNILDGLEIDGRPVEAVGAGVNRQVLDLLRVKHGFGGVVLSDWAITNDCDASCQTGTPAQGPASIGMPWGVESVSKDARFVKGVNAGLDQFGGVAEPNRLIDAVRAGRLSEARLETSVRRIIELKFALGLFESPFVKAEDAVQIVGSPAFRDAALDAQRRSLVLLENQDALLPLAKAVRKVYAPGLSTEALAQFGLTAVDDAAHADVAILRVSTPHQQLHPGFFFGARQHEGALAFEPDSPDYKLIVETSRALPTIVVVLLDRPAILTAIRDKPRAIVAEFGVSDRALLQVLTGQAPIGGKLPFELPSSMSAVEGQRPDTPHDSRDPLYPIFFGR
jgi:beta-glucosidase